MSRMARLALCLGLPVMTAGPLQAFPAFLQIFQGDPLRRPEVDGCSTCHLNPGGGGPRNEFGQAFAANEMRITPLLRAQFPDRFVYPTTEISAGNVIHFADPENTTLVVEFAGQPYLVDLESQAVPGIESGAGTAPPPSVLATQAEAVSNVDPATLEGAFFGPRIVNLPNGKGLQKGNVEFLIGHRFSLPLFTRNSPANLFGFDSSAFVTFGGEVGLTD